MTNNNSITTPLMIVTVIIAVVMNGFFTGQVGNQNQISAIENQLSLYPNIETMGVVLSGVALPKTARLMYRHSGETAWQEDIHFFVLTMVASSAVCLDFPRLAPTILKY